MSVHLLNARPQPLEFNGERFFPASYVTTLEDALRSDMRDRSALRGFMATVKELWDSMPERFDNVPFARSPDTFRKHALIKTGHCDVDTFCFNTPDEARRKLTNIGYMARMAHGYTIIKIDGPVIHCITPHSQSLKAMGKEKFNKSKADVLDFCRGIVGVTS